MSSLAVLGCLYGDEGKAKITDFLAEKADAVIRFQGGNNAGHTIHLEDKKYVFHLVPAGILYKDKICVLGAGVVVNPYQLLEEMGALERQGIAFEGRFKIDPRTTLVLPHHVALDNKREDTPGLTKIGTTKRGIGPAYADNVSRVALRVSHILDEKVLRERLENFYHTHGFPFDDFEEQVKELFAVGQKLKQYTESVPYLLNEMYEEGKTLLFEGAQGALLDVNFGTYPFVTSSNTISGAIATGTGFPPVKIERVVGVYKSYFTRVGNGPFVTELNDETGEKIRTAGNEFGATTGRPRRCGWFDAVAARYTAMINGVSDIALTLLDVLDDFDTIKICTHYKIDGKLTDKMPDNNIQYLNIEPVYEELPGWKSSTCQISGYKDLPQNAKNYIHRIEELLRTPVSIVSVGPDRKQTIIREEA